MATYRVSFFKNLISCYGKPFNVRQRSMVIRSARNQARAIKAAQTPHAIFRRVP